MLLVSLVMLVRLVCSLWLGMQCIMFEYISRLIGVQGCSQVKLLKWVRCRLWVWLQWCIVYLLLLKFRYLIFGCSFSSGVCQVFLLQLMFSILWIGCFRQYLVLVMVRVILCVSWVLLLMLVWWYQCWKQVVLQVLFMGWCVIGENGVYCMVLCFWVWWICSRVMFCVVVLMW